MDFEAIDKRHWKITCVQIFECFVSICMYVCAVGEIRSFLHAYIYIFSLSFSSFCLGIDPVSQKCLALSSSFFSFLHLYHLFFILFHSHFSLSFFSTFSLSMMKKNLNLKPSDRLDIKDIQTQLLFIQKITLS